MATVVRVLTLAFLLLVSATNAQAEPFTVLPGGNIVFNISLSSSGYFKCGAVVQCTGAGTNAITLHSGSGDATFTFTGVDTSAVIGNTTVPVRLGTFEGSTTSGFSLPGGIGRYASLLSFTFNISQSGAAAGASRLTWDFNQGFTRFGEASPTYLPMPTGPQPPQYHYSAIYYTFRVFPLTLPLNGSKDLVADAGAVPEPGSIALVATGLIGAWRRRRSKVRAIPSRR